MVVKSNLLNIEIELTETTDGLHILPHAKIEEILMKYPRITVDVNAKCLNPNMCVVEAVAHDLETGTKTPIKIGESNPMNLEDPISKKFPALMAYQRATDRAVILLLDLPSDKKIYSSIEIDNLNFKKVPERIDSISDIPEVVKAPTVGIHTMEKENTDDIAMVSLEEPIADDSVPVVSKDTLFPDDTIMLVGGTPCIGKPYGEIKDTKAFEAFLKWAASNKGDAKYPEKEKQMQFDTIRAYAIKMEVA